MTTDKNEYDFVLHYFATGRLNTVKTLRQVKARAGVATAVPIWKRTQWAAVAASVLVLLAFGAYMLLMPATVTLQTADAQRVFTLPDSTRVTLAPHSTLSYKENDCRNVEMSGKIYYQVRHDAARPFDVQGEKSHVRVLGTQFEVDESSAAATSSVFVTSGKVFFTARHNSNGIILTKGMKAVLSNGSTHPTLSEQSDINDVAWATHKFHFSNTPMEDVMRVLSEYYGKAFTASDTSKRLTGDFDARNREQVVNIIEETLGITISN